MGGMHWGEAGSSPPSAGARAPDGVRQLTSPTWRIWFWSPSAPVETHLVYITASPDQYAPTAGLISDFAARCGPRFPQAIRLVRDEQVLARVNAIPEWTGKAFTLYAATWDEAMALAQQVDVCLAGHGLYGPPVTKARSFGGRSGMLFLRSADGPEAPSNNRRDRLSALLGGSDG